MEVPHYDELCDQFPGRGVYKKLRALMSKVVEEKKALGVKLKDVEANAGQAVLAYIKNSLPIDKKFAASRGGRGGRGRGGGRRGGAAAGHGAAKST
ncbi:MAG: hypothetical protein QF687_03005, partial [Nitrospinaceae bacterium]|nr:hypothetical protein [Nitrospinaceae bacterium]